MGKLIETKYPDVQNRIIKDAAKRNKHTKKLPPPLLSTEVTGKQSHKRSKPKRKNSSILDIDEPKSKIVKIENENLSVQENSNAFLKMLNELPKQSQIVTSEFCFIRGNNSGDFKLKLKSDDTSDLFLDDEIRSSYENYINKDFSFHIIDEISLEGLDGITLEAFWKRFSMGVESPVVIDDNIKELIWKFICSSEGIQFYKLPEPRGVLDIYDRFKYLNTDIGVVMEMAYQIPEIYPHQPISNSSVRGSCALFYTRSDVSSEVKNLTLKEAEKTYGRTLVIVASQELREKAIFNESADPNMELQTLEYCILERLGRSRKHGELTQGNMSITAYFKMDPKSTFHYKKQLIQNALIAKQFFYIKSAVTDQNKTGRLLHLKRFYHAIKPKPLLIAEEIINLIKSKPNYRLEFSELRKVFCVNQKVVMRIVKSQQFHKFFRTDSTYPYRTLYPNAKKSEYMRKARPVEKYVRCLEIIDPYVNLSAQWYNDQEDSDEDDDESEGEEEVTGGKIYNMECFKEVYYHILSKRNEGCSLQELEKLARLDHKTTRMALKKLVSKNVVNIKRVDKGKQRSLIYNAKYLEEEEVAIDRKPDPPKSSGSVLSRIRETQKAAIKKLGQVEIPEAIHSSPESLEELPREIKFEVPTLKCPFFIRVWNEFNAVFCKTYIKADFINTYRNDLIKLNKKLFRSEQSFEINIMLNYDHQPTPPQIKENFATFYVSKEDINYVTKTILLKALLQEIMIKNEDLTCLNRKRKRPVVVSIPMLSENREKHKHRLSDKKLQYMGDNPISIFKEQDGNVSVEIYVSTDPETYRYDKEYPKYNRDLSERVLSRIQFILNIINEKNVFEDIYRMLKVIQEEERKSGYEKKIDRKSLARIFNKLVTEGYIKIFKVVISDENITKSQAFICHPSITHTNSTIQSAYQQLKWKYFVGTHKKAVKTNVPSVQKSLQKKVQQKGGSPFSESDVMNSIADLKEMNKMKFMQLKSKYNRYIGKTYGFKPKVIRMRIIHEFLFYLIYAYERTTKPLTNDDVRNLFKSYRINLSHDDLEDMPKIYCKEISWKMFMPPLPYHKGWGDGWALLCDIILRLPISVLCKVHNITFEISEITDILNHPIKRFYLVKDLPETIRNAVLFKRKYLFDIHESISRLAQCGLLQFGPQKYKEKDQVFIYLNRRAALLDTTSSEPSYHKVTDKEYKRLTFVFNDPSDLDTYWYNVYGISLNTKLNAKHSGQLVTLVDMSAKPELASALTYKTQEEAIRDDNGTIPGDKRGAAGLDSSLWIHIMRNWLWTKTIKAGTEPPQSVMGLRKEKLEKIPPRNFPYNELQTASSNKVYLHSNKDGKETKPKTLHKNISVPTRTSKTNQRITRKIPSKRKKVTERYHDQVDKAIVKKIGPNIRVKWTEREDKLLVLCRAASVFLNPKLSNKQFVSCTVMRDVLHRICPESRTKTSRACQRRLKFRLSDIYPNLEDSVSSLLKLKPISKYYSALRNSLSVEVAPDEKPFKLREEQLSAAFIILMSYLVEHQEEVENILQGNMVNINYLADDNLNDIEKNLIELEECPMKIKECKDVEDVKKEVLKTVIHSSLEYKHPGWAFQLFKIYQKYSDTIIRDAVLDLKRSQAIAFERFDSKKRRIRWHTPFQLSNIFVFSQSTTFNETTAVEAYKAFSDIKENRKFLDFSQETVDAKKYGRLLGLNEFFSIWEKFQLKFFLPQNTVILNPHIKDHSELVHELAIRWQISLKRMSQETVDTELEPETENDNYRNKTNESGIYSTYKESGPSTSQNKFFDRESDDTHNNPLDVTVESSNLETIGRLKTWVTDCMETERERRSPSPEFMDEDKDDVPRNESARDSHILSKTDNSEDNEPEKSNLAHKKPPSKEDIPTLEEIKEGMLIQSPPSKEKRKIPYITDLSPLLNKENFAELNTDEKTLERLKNHFITQYALLEDIVIEEPEEMQDFYMVKYLQKTMTNKKLWYKLQSEMIVKPPSEAGVYESLDQSDIALAEAIIAFVCEQKELGATGPQIKAQFRHMEKTCPLEHILTLMTDNGVLLRTGVCSIRFVHFTFQTDWLVETFALTHDEQKFVEKNTAFFNKDDIDRQLGQKSLIMVKVSPWTKVDGTLNKESLKMWLCNIFSHCLDYPNILFMKLCEKFCYLKPVDIFSLVEILQQLGSVEVYVYEQKEPNLFSTWEASKQRYATFLDDLEEMYVAPTNISMISVGSFFCDCEE